MGLVTERAEWKSLLAALETEGIPVSAATIRQEQTWDEKASQLVLEPRIEIEIRDERTWAMGSDEQEQLERKLRAVVPRLWDGPDLRVIWARPVALAWAKAYLDVTNKLWRELRRRRVAVEAFDRAEEAISELHDRVWNGAEDHGPLLAKVWEILAEARRHPQEAQRLPSLPPGQVAVTEVMAVLRRIAERSVHPEIISPKDGWKCLCHGIGEFRVDGWSIEAFKRNFGMKYVQEARSPDGRIGTFETFQAREGNPFSLMEDDEQDAICERLEWSESVPGLLAVAAEPGEQPTHS